MACIVNSLDPVAHSGLPTAWRIQKIVRVDVDRAVSPFILLVNIPYDDNLYAWCRDWSEDSYVLFILLSIAQRQYYRKHARHNTAYQACLFVTNPASPQDVTLFDADIPTALPDELDDPRMVPQRRKWLIIHRTRMSIEPRKVFLARLVAALSSRGDGNAADGEGRGNEGRGDGEGRGDRADEEGSGR
ncbi:uncharacterized protein BBA_09557 [Beauveria bassiana ARSEF 2860]|uniref:Uncharacterized protein n=1 Tax=Beauveria bassiana (strain ARSEF 2860) TaxID=655819 RepID=J5J450_BEAB2|nr:uncharacterized protein BBA_09557 [Beauveria bassiana ARSEF 2860]EJP61478.1 hypothetical protein BBA_09557 [Beauveria bassiana ARSEF 2860]